MQQELLAKVVAALDVAGVPHMVTGSFASTFHGEPRMTRDIDLVIDPAGHDISLFVEQFEPESFYIDDAAAATASRDMFNVIDVTTGWKVDLIVRKDRPFSIEEFGRRVSVELFGVRTFVASVEDTILSKLEWSRMSGSDQQLRDVNGIVSIQRPTLDLEYLERWATELGIIDELHTALSPDA